MSAPPFNQQPESWDGVLKPATGWFDIPLWEIPKYWDLIVLFVKRDFVTFYKQSILGPLWYILQPLFNTIVFTIVFGNLAKIPTDGLPPFVFYLSGTVVWGYFSRCLNQIANTFVTNASIFGKVYFPRIVIPISIVISQALEFLIQFAFFLGFLFYFKLRGSTLQPNLYVLALPLIILQMAALGMGMGLLISALTSKYRDLKIAMSTAVQLWMYLTPVVYPLSQVTGALRALILLNPMTAVIESFRGAFFGVTTLTFSELLMSIGLTLVIFISGVIVFSRVEKTFMDTV
jgi:lipopolysaccharide transport system permease protein